MINADTAVQRPPDAKLLVVDSQRNIIHVPRSAFVEFLRPNDLVIANDAATLPASLPYQPLEWKAITMYVDPRARTMATLYGNDTAMQTVQARRAAAAGGTECPAYRAGSVLAPRNRTARGRKRWVP